MTGISYPLRFRSLHPAFRYRNAGSSGVRRSWSAAFPYSIGSVSSSSRSVSPMTDVCGTCPPLRSAALAGSWMLPGDPAVRPIFQFISHMASVCVRSFHTWSPLIILHRDLLCAGSHGDPSPPFSPCIHRKNPYPLETGKISSYPRFPTLDPQSGRGHHKWKLVKAVSASHPPPSMEAESSGMETTDVPLKEAAPSGVSKPAPLLVHWPERPLTDSSYPSLLDNSFT